jgi:hypothetical protein
MRRDASTESERKVMNKEILELTKALIVMRNNKIEWHSRLKMDLSQLFDQRNDEIKHQADLARQREKEEKRHKAKARASKPKAISDHCIQTVATDAPVDTSAPLQQIPPSPLHEDDPVQQAEPTVVIIPTTVA